MHILLGSDCEHNCYQQKRTRHSLKDGMITIAYPKVKVVDVSVRSTL